MARGKIKTDMGPSSSRGRYPVNTGTIEDAQSRVVYDFEQPLFKELGLAAGVKASFSIVTDATGKDIAVGLEPVERGEVLSISSDGGTLKERASGSVIEFAHSRVKEANIVLGSLVQYERVDFNGKPVASGITLIR